MSRKAADRPVAKVIEFEDRGQDFLRWGLDRQGYVRTCEPAQGFAWLGRKVQNPDPTQRGEHPQLRTHPGRWWKDPPVKHRVTKVTEL